MKQESLSKSKKSFTSPIGPPKPLSKGLEFPPDVTIRKAQLAKTACAKLGPTRPSSLSGPVEAIPLPKIKGDHLGPSSRFFSTPLEPLATRNKCHASRNRCLTSSNKKLPSEGTTLPVRSRRCLRRCSRPFRPATARPGALPNGRGASAPKTIDPTAVVCAFTTRWLKES